MVNNFKCIMVNIPV